MASSETSSRKKAVIITIVLALILWFIPPVWRLKGGYTTVTQWRKSTGAQQIDVGPEKPDWIAVNAVSKHVLYAFVAAEDMRFYEHHGLDFHEISDSLKLNWKKGAYIRGGSTISQQVVKMAMLSRDKSIIRKAREAVGAVSLELILDKNEILEWYINLAEFGDGVYGLRAAAKHYFQTKPELLTIQQAAHLALVLPSPNGWSVGLRRRNLTEFGHRRFASIVTRMKLAGYITEAQWMNSLATGNFGRPVHSYEKIIARVRRKEQLAREQDLEELPAALDEDSQELNLEEEAEDTLQDDAKPDAEPAEGAKPEQSESDPAGESDEN